MISYGKDLAAGETNDLQVGAPVPIQLRLRREPLRTAVILTAVRLLSSMRARVYSKGGTKRE